jgi:hypothetical protein
LTADSHGELDKSLAKLLELEEIPESAIPGGLGKGVGKIACEHFT